MPAGLLLAAALIASPSPSQAPSPSPKTLDERRFELHLGGQGRGRFRQGASFGGGAQVGLGVRLWRGLWLEAGVGEGIYQLRSSPSPEPSAFRHLGPHDEPGAAEINETAAAGAASARGRSALLAGEILLGLRYELRLPQTRLRPSVLLGASHLHEATLDEFLAAPGKTLAGTGDFIVHRTGAALGLGLRVPFPERWGAFAPRISARFDANFAYYFDDAPGQIQAGVGVGLQALF